MEDFKMLNFIEDVLENVPNNWLRLTTHRLDIYEEDLAKVQFLEHFEDLFVKKITNSSALNSLPTAYDYIRLGHPLSCILEWAIAKINNRSAESVISFSSDTIGILAILRSNLLANKNSQILFKGKLPKGFDAHLLNSVYGYNFELRSAEDSKALSKFDRSTILISEKDSFFEFDLSDDSIDFYVNYHPTLGSILFANGKQNQNYISDIQHVRRRETIAMTPANALITLKMLTGQSDVKGEGKNVDTYKQQVQEFIKDVTHTPIEAIVGSSGLSIQYAILMGLIDHANEHHKGQDIKIVVPPNCYGGTNDQARRVAACIDNVEVVDLPVDDGNDMVKGIDAVLDKIATQDAVPYIIAEIPTNPRVEVPDLSKLKEALNQERKTPAGKVAVDPVFILDQTFCPNMRYVGDGDVLSKVRCISFSSGSKFPSGGRCNAGYCVGNHRSAELMKKVAAHLALCDNEATDLQYEILAKQMPSMISRIEGAYKNTRSFVDFIQEHLPEAKINFVSEALAEQGFTPSVFSIDLPTKGNTEEERESYKRALNLKLINLMINKIPNESKFCVSYGQLKGCYWTIPATSTQGTTKEVDKDYIVRASVSPDLDLEKHKQVFLEFIKQL